MLKALRSQVHKFRVPRSLVNSKSKAESQISQPAVISCHAQTQLKGNLSYSSSSPGQVKVRLRLVEGWVGMTKLWFREG